MLLRWLVLSGLVFLGSVTTARLAHAEKLVKAELVSHTNDDNKDFDTGVWVDVRTADKKTSLAVVGGADATKEYKDNTDHALSLVVMSEGSTVAECNKFVFRVGIKANGKDKWKFKAKVTLYFDNGKTLVQELGDTDLESKNKLVWTEWAGGK